MSEAWTGPPWLVPLLLGVVAGCGFVLVADSLFDGRARSLVFPQVIFLGAALGMLYTARAARWLRGQALGQAAVLAFGFYATWLLFFLLLAVILEQPHA